MHFLGGSRKSMNEQTSNPIAWDKEGFSGWYDHLSPFVDIYDEDICLNIKPIALLLSANLSGNQHQLL